LAADGLLGESRTRANGNVPRPATNGDEQPIDDEEDEGADEEDPESAPAAQTTIQQTNQQQHQQENNHAEPNNVFILNVTEH